MGMLHKVDDVWSKNCLSMTSCNVSRICILQTIQLCDWVTVMDTLAGILMVLMGCMEDMV